MRDAVAENQAPVKGVDLVLINWHTFEGTNPCGQPIDGNPCPGGLEDRFTGSIKAMSAISIKPGRLAEGNGDHVVNGHRLASEHNGRRLV